MPDLGHAPYGALNEFLEIFSAERGNMQLLDLSRSHRILTIVAQRGFDSAFLTQFRTVSADDETACGRALRLNRTIVVPDVETDASFAPYRMIASRAGFRSVISTPVISAWGHLVGIMSAHFPHPGEPSASKIAAGEDIACRAAHAFLESVDPG